MSFLFAGGDYKTGRYNEGNKDLNRNFPTWMDLGKNISELKKDREPETKVGSIRLVSIQSPAKVPC